MKKITCVLYLTIYWNVHCNSEQNNDPSEHFERNLS